VWKEKEAYTLIPANDPWNPKEDKRVGKILLAKVGCKITKDLFRGR